MTLDIRLPIGLLFGLLGALLVVQGCLGGPSPVRDAARPVAGAGFNVDLVWGSVMLVFAGGMLLFARRQAIRRRQGAG